VTPTKPAVALVADGHVSVEVAFEDACVVAAGDAKGLDAQPVLVAPEGRDRSVGGASGRVAAGQAAGQGGAGVLACLTGYRPVLDPARLAGQQWVREPRVTWCR